MEMIHVGATEFGEAPREVVAPDPAPVLAPLLGAFFWPPCLPCLRVKVALVHEGRGEAKFSK